MLDEVEKKMAALQMLANGDEEYYRMLQQMRELEKGYDAVVQTLKPDQQDAVCEFVSLCESMSRRILEIACGYMDFK